MNPSGKQGPESVESEVERLRAEVERLQRYKVVVEGQAWTAQQLARLLALIWISPKLVVAIQRWIEARRARHEGLPLPETADLAAALIRRLIRVGAIAFLVAFFPTILLVWQNMIMLDQNQYLRQQIAEMRAQADRTEAQALDTQITQYFDLLTSGDDGKFWAAVSFFRSPGVRERAVPQVARLALTANGSVRCVALSALVALVDRRTGNPHGVEDPKYVDVSSVLRGVARDESLQAFAPLTFRCAEQTLSNVDLSQMDFQSAEFARASLQGINFSKSNLRGARFTGAQLNFVDFRGADLRGGTSFRGASLEPYLLLSEHALDDVQDLDVSGAIMTPGALDAFKKADAVLNWAIVWGPSKRTPAGDITQARAPRNDERASLKASLPPDALAGLPVR